MYHGKDWIDIIAALGPLFGSIMIACMGYAQWRTFEKDRQAKQFQHYISNYYKVERVIALAHSKEFSKSLIYARKARDEAHIFLSQEICEFIDKLMSWVKKASKAQGIPSAEEKMDITEEEIQQLYRKYFPHA